MNRPAIKGYMIDRLTDLSSSMVLSKMEYGGERTGPFLSPNE